MSYIYYISGDKTDAMVDEGLEAVAGARMMQQKVLQVKDTIIDLLKNTGVVKALVSSTPDEGTRLLYNEDPARIVPFLRPYHDDINSSNWYSKERVFSYILERLEMPIYKGVGEFHIHNPFDADSPIIKKTVRLAVERDLFIHVHSGHRAVETIFTLLFFEQLHDYPAQHWKTI